MSRIVGRFFFKIDTSGKLIGKFSNNTHLINYDEIAFRRNSGNDFLGDFDSSWTDDIGSFTANLKISPKNNSQDLFSIYWQGDGFEFWGEGFIVDDILIGDYRNFKTI